MKSAVKKAYLVFLLSIAAAAPAIAADDKPADGDAKPIAAASKPHWAYQPVQAQVIPEVAQKAWVRTPIDAFILAKLEAKNVKPSAEVDRVTFIRRATLDAWGIIPTPEEVKAFVADRSPDAYEKLVDRLLESPHYGERQARRWLDLARYADSVGYTNDELRPNMWRYRDYVINAFNNDKPYNLFVKEQIAGDEISPASQEALVATGFLRGYPDDSNSRDLVLKKYENTTDIVDTTGQVFLGQTIGCARCHDHKFDKISMKDYYSFRAFFANASASDNLPAIKGEQETQFQAARQKYRDATKSIRDRQKEIIDSVRDEAVKYHKERFLPDTRESLFKAEKDWTPFDRWINHRDSIYLTDATLSGYLQDAGEDKSSPNYSPAITAKWEEYKKLRTELRAYDDLRPEGGSDTVSAITELGHPDSPPTFVFFSGIHDKPLYEVQPAFPEVLGSAEPVISPSETSSGRRTALANWIANADNPLTSRVFVNRVWNQYFGHGIVETVSDFGKAGAKPSNPELLDYLAEEFVTKDGWSPKKLHREILLSSTYRQASASRADASAVDPSNKLLWAFPRQRLDAEQIRDSLLVASGQLEDKIGGPSVSPPIPENLGAGRFWRTSADAHEHNRRSLYILTRRSVPYPLTLPFDAASAQQLHSTRDVTTTPLQALTLVNADLVFQWSQSLAGRVIREAGPSESAQFDRLYQILFGRTPDKNEKATLVSFLDKHEQVLKEQETSGKLTINLPSNLKDTKNLNPLRAAAFVDLVHAVANSNEFVYRL
jgi:hypothetical protein